MGRARDKAKGQAGSGTSDEQTISGKVITSSGSWGQNCLVHGIQLKLSDHGIYPALV